MAHCTYPLSTRYEEPDPTHRKYRWLPDGPAARRPTEDFALAELEPLNELAPFVEAWLRETVARSPADALYLHQLLANASANPLELRKHMETQGLLRPAFLRLLDRLAAYAATIPAAADYLKGVDLDATQEKVRSRNTANAASARRCLERRYAEDRARVYLTRRALQIDLAHLVQRPAARRGHGAAADGD